MNEDEWLAAIDPEPMLEFLRGRTTERKLRLLMYACCQRVGYLVEEAPYKSALEAVLAYAEGRIGREGLSRAWIEAKHFWYSGKGAAYHPGAAVVSCAMAALPPADQPEEYALEMCHLSAVRALSRAQALDGNEANPNERKEQSILVRHIIGNPFRLYPVPLSWPSPVIQL